MASKPPQRSRLEMIPMGLISDNPFQIDHPPDDAEVIQAAYLIRDRGLTFPVVVRSRGTGYELATGRLWLAACRLLGVAQVPALAVGLDDRTMATLAYDEATFMKVLSTGHGTILLRNMDDPRVAIRMARLRRQEEGFAVQVDPEAARNLPLPQKAVFQPAPALPPSEPVVLSEDAVEALTPVPVPAAQPRGIHDTLLGIRCRHLPPLWFQTVSEAGRLWVLENVSSGGQVEITASPVKAASLSALAEAFRGHLLSRFAGTAVSEARRVEQGACFRAEVDVDEAGGNRHRFVVLWNPARAALMHLSNAPRFFLYDLKPFEEMVAGSELIR